MKIEDIKSPAFLKDLSIEELYQLSNDIRSFLLESVSKTGGHLSSNLGIIELTIALHYVFNAPIDKILFDVGHQSYTHKILTGRANQFKTLRQFNGISGFQKMEESEYDCFEAGHSSTALSAALGMACARDLNNERYNVISVVGDGSMMSGLSLEALNQIGYLKKKLIIIFNDNNMSISKNVGALNKSFNKLRISPKYNKFKYDLKVLFNKYQASNSILDVLYNIKETIKNGIVDGGIFEEFGLNYVGPIDGNNIEDMIKAFEKAKNSNMPIVIHVVTKKGKGYKFTENDTTGRWHGVTSFNLETGIENKIMPQGYISYSKYVSRVVDDLMTKNDDIITITPAMKAGSSLENLFIKYPKRCFDVGIAEDHALEFACGLALNHKKPFVSIYSSFLQRAYDQLNHDVCRMNLPVVIGIDRAGIVGEDGETHQGVFDIAFLSSLPNMIITEGKDAQEIANLINLGFNLNLPFAIRYPKGITLNTKTIEYKKLKLGKWIVEVNNKNAKAIIITYGDDVLKIKDIIIKNDLPIILINALFIKPIDEHLLDELCKYNLPIFVYTTDIIKGGLGDSILNYYAKTNKNINIDIMGIDDIYIKQGDIETLKKYHKINIDTLLKKIKKIC